MFALLGQSRLRIRHSGLQEPTTKDEWQHHPTMRSVAPDFYKGWVAYWWALLWHIKHEYNPQYGYQRAWS